MKREKCTACRNRLAAKGFKRCDECRARINAKLRARVAHRRRLKLCRCGRKRAPGRKGCQLCLDYFSSRHAELYENRRLDGLCPMCGRVPDEGKIQCKRCLARGRINWAALPLAKRRQLVLKRKLYSRNEQPEKVAARVQACKDRWRAAGRCITCGTRCAVNPHTRKPYAQCKDHRDKAMRARRARVSLSV